MDTITTITGLIVAISIMVLANWKSRQPRELGEVSMIPYTGVQIVALVAALVFAGHLISLVTGTPFRGRIGY